MVMLEVKAQSSEVQARCHVMIVSRQTSLRDVARKFNDIRPEALGRQRASNGILNLHVTLEHVVRQRIFIIGLDTLSCSLTVSVNATLELQYLGLMMVTECIRKAEGKRAREREELSQKLQKKNASLGQTKGKLDAVKNELRILREKESVLASELEDGTQEIFQLNTRDEEIRQQQESMSARRLETQRRTNELWNSKPTTTGENSEQPMAEVNQTLHWAVLNGHEAVVQMLANRGADIAVKDQEG